MFSVPELEGGAEVLGELVDGLPPAFEEVLPAVLPEAAGGTLVAAGVGGGLPLGGLADGGVEVPVCGIPVGPTGGGGVGPPADAVGASGFVVLGPLIVVPMAFAGWAGAAGGGESAAASRRASSPSGVTGTRASASPAMARSSELLVLRSSGWAGTLRSRTRRALS